MMKKRNKEVSAGDHSPESGNMVVEEEVRRGPWTLEEDSLLTNYIVRHGEGRWNLLAKCAGLKRTGKSCRLRWLNYLKPDTKRGNLSSQEQLLILQLHSKWGNRWSKIAQHLPGRTDNEIKNYWRTRVQKQARLLNIHSTHENFFEALKYLWTPTLLHKIQQTSSNSSFNATTPSSFTDSDSQPITPPPPPPPHYHHNSLISFSPPPPSMPHFAPSSSTPHSPLQPLPYNPVPQNRKYCYNDLDFKDLQSPQQPQSSWGDPGVPHPAANINHINYYNNLGYDDETMSLGNYCTLASTSPLLQPSFDPSTDDQCCQMENTGQLPYADAGNTLWNMDDIWRSIAETGTG